MSSDFRPSILGSVVAKQVLSNFLVVHTCYRPGEYLSHHSHEQAFISVALRGSYVETWKNKNWDCAVGQTIFHSAGEAHSNRFRELGGEVISLEISSAYLSRLKDVGLPTDKRLSIRNPHSYQLGLRLHQEINNPDTLSGLATEGLALELLAEMLRQGKKRTIAPGSEWLANVHQVVTDRYRETIGLSELALQAAVHPMHLARAFRQRYGTSIGDYVRTLRITAASAELAHSNLPIAEIASRHGFSDQSHLCRLLKKHTGVSPNRYRRSCTSLPVSPSMLTS